MTDTELVVLTQPYSNLLAAYGDLRADEYITDKQLAKLQRSVISEADAVVKENSSGKSKSSNKKHKSSNKQ